MNAEIELPPLPDGWADGPVEIRYGAPPIGSMILTCFGWDRCSGSDTQFVYAVRKWVPAIVKSHLLEPGWIVIDEDGTYYNSASKPKWCEETLEWAGVYLHCLCVRETPQLTGRNAIWEIK